MTHDPLCPLTSSPDLSIGVYCRCRLIARVREDERAWLAGTREADLELARIKSVAHFNDGYAAALRDAVEAITVQSPAIWSYPLHGAERTGVWLDDAVAAIEALGGER